MTKILVLFYSTYGHVQQLAEAFAKGAATAGVEVDIKQVPETLPADVLAKIHAPPKSNHAVASVADLPNYDGIVLGLPTRYGTVPAQVKTFWDGTGGLWASGALAGKFATIVSSTATQHGGLETTALTFLPNLFHHGIIYVPLGYTHPDVGNIKEVHGASPYGAGTIAGSDGSRQVSDLEKSIAEHHGSYFAKIVAKSSSK